MCMREIVFDSMSDLDFENFWSRNIHTSTHSHILSLILLLRCNAEQELVMHYMLLALAEVRGKQDQYY